MDLVGLELEESTLYFGHGWPLSILDTEGALPAESDRGSG
jgi:hypothetical protein